MTEFAAWTARSKFTARTAVANTESMTTEAAAWTKSAPMERTSEWSTWRTEMMWRAESSATSDLLSPRFASVLDDFPQEVEHFLLARTFGSLGTPEAP
jgi:hypothetical protein